MVVRLHFATPPEITVHPVLIHVTGTYNGLTLDDVKPTQQQVDAVFNLLDGLYPAHVNRGSTYDITVSPAINKDDLLDRLRDYDGANGREMFVGLLPADQAGHKLAANEKNSDGSFVAGYGAVEGRGAWADADNAIDPAHELGHNIGFDRNGAAKTASQRMSAVSSRFHMPVLGAMASTTRIGGSFRAATIARTPRPIHMTS